MVHFETYSKEWRRVLRDPQDDFHEQIILRHGLKDIRRNVPYRRWLVDESERDPEFGQRLWTACSRDILFFANSFAWFKEPRKGVGILTKDVIFPFISWPAQDWSLTRLHEEVGERNIMFTKPRGFSFSWQVVLVYFFCTTFEYDRDFGISSGNERKVDRPHDASTLLGKVDILAKYMPNCLLPKSDIERGNLLYLNKATGGVIHGFPTTANIDRGGRKYSSFGDELAEVDRSKDRRMITSLRGVSNSLILGSTFGERRTCEFNELAFDEEYDAVRLRVDCWDIPAFQIGMYTTGEDGAVKILNTDDPPPADYKFILDGTVRSPVFDAKTRGMTKAEIAREFLVDINTASAPSLKPETVNALKAKFGEKPKFRFAVRYNTKNRTLKLTRDVNGPLSLFIDSPNGVLPPDDAYAIAADPSHGVDVNPSTLCVMSRSTGVQVGEFSSASFDYLKLANLTYCAAFWARGAESEAYVNFDSGGGIGKAFKKRIVKLGHRRFFKRSTADKGREDRTKNIGYSGGNEGFGEILAELIDACDRGDARILSEDCYGEFAEYVLVNGRYTHSKAASKKDAAVNEKSHGDRAVAAALAYLTVDQKPFRKPIVKEKTRLEPDTDEWDRACAEMLEAEFERQFRERGDALEADNPYVF